MSYDPEKHREKREKVLGVGRRGIRLGLIAVIVSGLILTSFGLIIIPKSLAWWNGRNLSDAIFKLKEGGSWPGEVVAAVAQQPGVKKTMTDKGGTRLVVTFDRTVFDARNVTPLFEKSGLNAVLLNRIDHSQHMRGAQGN
ncbi:MAG: hypothetical protein EG826_18480 [Deltaproteobacteria bacterium]|nr:hypothetical protein [Deltaproteobacteria bacterium]